MDSLNGLNSRDSLLGLLRSVVAPYERLQNALDASPLGMMVFDKSRLSFVNLAGRDFLRLGDDEVVGVPLAELSMLGPVGEAVRRGVEFSQAHLSPHLEEVVLRESVYRVRANRSSEDLCLITVERSCEGFLEYASQQPKSAQGEPWGDEHPLLTAVLLLAEVVAREVPSGGEASYLCHQILRMLSKTGDAAQKCRTRCAGEFRLEAFEIFREVLSLVRYSLPQSVVVESDIPTLGSGCEFPGSSLRCLLLQIAMDCVTEIEQHGVLKLSARVAEGSLVFEFECRSVNGVLREFDAVNLKQAKDVCQSLSGQLISWTENNRRVRLLNFPREHYGHPATGSGDGGAFAGGLREGEGRTVLLIDDEDSIRTIGKAALERFGYTVYLAGDGVEGLDVYSALGSKIDLIVLDLVMPRLGGAACFEKLKEINPDVKVVLMSGFTRNRRVNDLMARGCLFFLRKPFELADLVNTVREAYLFRSERVG